MAMSDAARELREAAKMMRLLADRTQAAAGSGWVHESLGYRYPQPVYNSDSELVAESYSGSVTAADVAQYIASWQPCAALAVAEWLDSAAEVAWHTQDDGASIHPDSHALKVARAYMRGSAPHEAGE